MQYSVLTYRTVQGRISHRSYIQCVNKAEANELAKALDSSDYVDDGRKAVVCVSIWTEAGKATLPIAHVMHLRAEVNSN